MTSLANILRPPCPTASSCSPIWPRNAKTLAVRLRAIRTLLYYGVKFGDIDKLSYRFRLLEESVEVSQSASTLP